MKKIFTFLFLLVSVTAFSQSTTLVISQVYGAGGNSGAIYKADFVELHNISGSSVSLSGMSIQYASSGAAGTWTGVAALPTAASIPAGGYYLIQMSVTGATGADLPTPDYVANPAIAMSGTNGRTALVQGVDPLSACPTGPPVIDLVGYGTSICFEGTTGATGGLTSILAAFRNNNGCTDTDDNSADFTTDTPAPRNSSSPVAVCGVVNPSLVADPTSLNFPNTAVGSASASQSYSLSGADLQGAPGNITVTSSSSDFQVSNDDATWGASTTISFSSATLSATNVYVRFTPQSVGAISGAISNTGGGVIGSADVAVFGIGEAPVTPVLSATTLTSFGNVCLNTSVGPNSFTVNGLNLTAGNLSIGPLNGFSFSTTAAGTYSASLSLSQTGGSYSQDIFVMFMPTAIQSYDGNITISGGAATDITVSASGSGANNPPTAVSGLASAITYNAATLAGSISVTGCSAVTAYGFEYSTTSGFVSGTVASSSNLSGTDFTANLMGLQPATTYYYKAFATNAGGTAYGVEMSFTTAIPQFASTSLEDFGAFCLNTSSDAQSFTLTSSGLGTSNVMIGPLAGYAFSTSASGPFTASLSITQPGGPFSKDIFVVFTPVAEQVYNGNIPVTGGSAAAFGVAVSGSGEDLAPAIVTGASNDITPWSATLGGTISFIGCTPVTLYGIEYSGISGFTPGIGTKMQSSDLSGTGYTVNLNKLAPNTVYYYRAYGINDGGISYGEEQSFTTLPLKNGLIIYGSQIPRGTSLHYSITGIKPGHYQARIYDATGRNIFRQDVITQLNFINEWFTLPSYIGTGVYYLQLYKEGFSETRNFMVR